MANVSLKLDFNTKDQVLFLLMTSKKETIATITAATTKAKHYKLDKALAGQQYSSQTLLEKYPYKVSEELLSLQNLL